jgi:hypothetical protein
MTHAWLESIAWSLGIAVVMATVVYLAGGTIPVAVFVATTLFVITLIAMNGTGHGSDQHDA